MNATTAVGRRPPTTVQAIYEVARKEFLQHLRTKRLLIVVAIMAIFLVLVTLFVGPRATSNWSLAQISREHFMLGTYFGMFGIGGLQFTQLLAIVLTADAICSEWNSRTVFLLLSKPISRTAFVLGKFAGNLFTVVVTLVTVFVGIYVIMQPFYVGGPSGAEVAGFFAMLGVIVLGSGTFAAIALFVSTLTRSTATSMMITVGLWLLAFPFIGAMGALINMGTATSFDSLSVTGWRYLNPVANMQAGARLLFPEPQFLDDLLNYTDRLNPFSAASPDIGIACIFLALYMVIFVAASLFVVRARNFE